MGNFFCINKVSPQDTIDEVLSSGHGSRHSRPGSSTGYERDEAEMIKQLRDEGIVPKMREGGLAFEVNIGEKDPVKRPPRRLARLEHRPVPGISTYNLDEKQLMADILRLEKRANKRLQGRITDERIFDAKGKRYINEAGKRAKVKAKLDKKMKVVDAEERKKNMRELAKNTKEKREKAVKKKLQ